MLLVASVCIMFAYIVNVNVNTTYSLYFRNDGLGMQSANQKFTFDFYDYLSKNQTYIIVIVDVRGSAGRGEKTRQAANGVLGTSEAVDASRVIRSASHSYSIESSRSMLVESRTL